MAYPIILAHGVCRFDALWNDLLNTDNSDDPALDNLHYFKGIRSVLMKQNKFSVFHSKVSWGGSVKKRAGDLKENVIRVLKETGAEKVNIIGHSMGGLDARHMLFDEREKDKIHEKVASLTTISTPHEGSAFSDWATEHVELLPNIIQKLGLDIKGLYDLRTEICKEFNNSEEVTRFEEECEPDIMFQSFAGKQDFYGVFNALKIPFYVIEKQEGDNDGFVSVSSAIWRQKYFKGFLENADHLNELGWWDPDQFLTGEGPEKLLQRVHEFYFNIAEGLP